MLYKWSGLALPCGVTAFFLRIWDVCSEEQNTPGSPVKSWVSVGGPGEGATIRLSPLKSRQIYDWAANRCCCVSLKLLYWHFSLWSRHHARIKPTHEHFPFLCCCKRRTAAEWNVVSISVFVRHTWSALLEQLVEVQRGGSGVGLLGSWWRSGRLLCFLHGILKRSAGVGPEDDRIMWMSSPGAQDLLLYHICRSHLGLVLVLVCRSGKSWGGSVRTVSPDTPVRLFVSCYKWEVNTSQWLLAETPKATKQPWRTLNAALCL